jgi:hypothetical protein
MHIQSDQNVSVHLMTWMQKSGAQRLFVHPVGIWGFFVRRFLYVFICMKFNSFYNSTFKIYKTLLKVDDYNWSQRTNSTAHYKCHKFHNRGFRVHLEKCNWIWWNKVIVLLSYCNTLLSYCNTLLSYCNTLF